MSHFQVQIRKGDLLLRSFLTLNDAIIIITFIAIIQDLVTVTGEHVAKADPLRLQTESLKIIY